MLFTADQHYFWLAIDQFVQKDLPELHNVPNVLW
jgi:hypothetical protein